MQLRFTAAVFLAVSLCTSAPLTAQASHEEPSESASPGYALIAPLGSTDSFLINMDGGRQGGLVFRAPRYPLDYEAFQGKNLDAK